ncbi:hypothetical protein CAL29_29855 [Bordetella genomosp. 10]|uniref:Glycosyltransferase 2-like domain-containing protein n=2 Tax=Bordetella genomosp. 10 TaxID=1416804 RepID=A0A261S510_9BORD|nr:hypothetical protein CAL29_29855 [Bordetella genomosp. 10]
MAHAGKREDASPGGGRGPAAGLVRGLRQFGGFKQVVRRAIGLARREGWAGVGRGLMALGAAIRRQGGDGRNDYESWVARYDTMSDARREQVRTRAAAMVSQPLVSVIMPVYNPEPRWLEAAIASVQAQLYPHWELCIADDASSDPVVKEMLQRCAARDARIRVTFRERNGHISEASNTALGMARGDWVALFDHDDLLSEDALFCIVEAINRHADAGLVYSDEDKITDAGVRCVPHFKPDWNYELFLSYNFICHLGVYRRALVEEVGGFRKGLEGAQDYDLALRCVERLAPEQIVHVPRVLYHWRMHAASTAVGGQSKPYALPAGERALNEHLKRRGVAATAEFQPAGYCQTRYMLPSPPPRVSIVVMGGAAGDTLFDAWLADLGARTDYDNREIVVASITPATEDVPLQRVAAVAAAANGEIVVLLAPFMQPRSAAWLSELVAQAIQADTGAVGPRVLDADGRVAGTALLFGADGVMRIAHRGLKTPDEGYFHRAAVSQAVTALSPLCVAVRKSRFMSAGGMASGPQTLVAAVVDLCLRLRAAGLRNVYAGHVVLRLECEGQHSPAESAEMSPTAPTVRSQLLEPSFVDPAYNPNLTLVHEDFSLAWPPRLVDI